MRQRAWSAALRDRGGGVLRPEVGSRGERDGWLRAASSERRAAGRHVGAGHAVVSAGIDGGASRGKRG